MLSSITSNILSKNDESLESARLVQMALLPKERHFKRLFNDSFVFYKPQHVISGDFYWVGGSHNLRYLAVGDCTGHGVSAALLSVLALNLFEYVIMNKGIKKTNKILKEVDKKFIESFKDSNNDNYDNPWIDISLICIDEVKKQIHFSSGNRKLILTKPNRETHIYKGSRYPIGGWQIQTNRDFISHSIPFDTNDMIYLGSDGFQDQIGGPKNKKYKSKNLHKLLAQNSQLPLQQQCKLIQQEFTDWKQDYPQTDDVCIVGIKL